MKPTTRHALALSVIVAASVVCGCEKKTHTVDMKEFIAFKIRMQNELYDINMRLNAIEGQVFTNSIPPGTIRIPAGDHVLAAPILIKKRTEPETNRWDIKGVKTSHIYNTNYGTRIDQ